MVRTYWLVPVFYEASGHLDLQPFARIGHVEACRPRAMSLHQLYGVAVSAERASVHLRLIAQRAKREACV
jgi:hypothetical protein